MGKRILIILNSLKIGGGAERIATELGSALNKKEYEISFLTFYDLKPKYEYLGKEICLNEKVKNNLLLDMIKTVKRAKKINEICKKNNIDTVISFLFTQNLPTILSKVVFGNNSKIIISVRNNPIKNESFVFNQIMKRTYPKADKLIVQTRRIKEILSKKYSIDNSVVIPNMFDLDKSRDLSRKKISKVHEDMFNEDFIFITIGSLTEQKAQWYLIRSFKSISQHNSNVKLIILGDGPLREKLINLTKKLNIEDKVFFLGEVENVFPYLRKSDCFVFSSLYEGFPNVITEALSQNLPVISTDCVSGPREILCPELGFNENVEYPYEGEYGILTKPFEDKMIFKTIDEKNLSKGEKLFAKCLVELMKNEKLRERYLNNSKRVKDFKKEKIIKKWMNLINNTKYV